MDVRNREIADNERRRFIRFEAPLDLRLRLPNSGAGYVWGRIKNFSRFGCCLEIHSPDLPPHDDNTMAFEVRLPVSRSFTPIAGDVIWTHTINHTVRAGVQIRDIEPGAKREILDFGYDAWLEDVRRRRSANQVNV